MKGRLIVVATLGLGLGAVSGVASMLAGRENFRDIFSAIQSLCLIVATAILALRYYRKGCDSVAAGFLLYAIGEAVTFSGATAGARASVTSLGVWTALWAVSLLLVSLPAEFPFLVRLTGITSSILFFIIALGIFWGEHLPSFILPFPFFAYPILILTFSGWIWSLLNELRVDQG